MELREKTVKGLECCCDVQSEWKDARYVCPTCPYTHNGMPCETLAPLMEDALALLKAQEAVEPKREQACCGGLEYTQFFCGSCDMPVFSGAKYCPDCGRAVKWE